MLESQPLPEPALSVVADPLSTTADALVLGVFDDMALPLAGLAPDNERTLMLSELVERSGAKGKLGEVSTIVSPWEDGPELFVVVGLGAEKEAGRQLAFESASIAMRRLTDRQRERVHIALALSLDESLHDAIVAGAIYGCEVQAIYKSEPAVFVPTAIGFIGSDQASIDRGGELGKSVNLAKRLVNEPPSVIYPASFADQASVIAKECGLGCEVWDEVRLEKEGCRAILAVGAGSSKPPRLVILRHNGGKTGEAPLAIVGKGVTFDSGGLSIKPGDSM